MFRSVLGNRFVNETHVARLAESLQKKNLMPWQPVMINEDHFIIDGQHRIEAAKIAGLPVYYTIIPDCSLSDIQLLNANMRAWTLRDFAESYSKLGKKDYAVLLEFADTYNLPLTVAANLLAGLAVSVGGGTITRTIRDGEFEITQYDVAEDMAERVKELAEYTEGGVWRSREFIRAVSFLYDRGVEHTRLLEKLEAYPEKVGTCKDYREYVLLLQDIYNHRSHSKNKIDVFSALTSL